VLSRGVYPVKLDNIEQLRVFAALTGIVLALAGIVLALLGSKDADMVSLLATGVGGFELFFCGQALSRRLRSNNG